MGNRGSIRDGPLFFWRGGGMRNTEKNCLHGVERQNILFANLKGQEKYVCREVR